MAFAIDGSSGFISKLAKEGARSALFKVTATLKGVNLVSTQDGSALLPFMCKGVQMPTSSVGIVTVNYFGRPVKFPGNRTFEDITLTFINDEGYAVRNRIENWMDQINQMETNKRVTATSGKSGYVADLELQPLTKTGSTAGTQNYKFINCFPTSLDAIDLSWDSNDQIMEFTTTWAYDYFTHGTATQMPSGGPPGTGPG